VEKTVVGELSATLAALRSAGEIGFWILAVFLIIVIALVAIVAVYQRIVIGRFQAAAKASEEAFKTVDTKLRTFDTQLKTVETSLKERELGVKERDELRNIFSQQFAFVKDTNTELRTEITRLREQQTDLKNSMNATITAGLQDIRERLTQVSVREIIAQVPDSFRKDLESEFSAALRVAIQKMNDHLGDKNAVQQYIDTLTAEFKSEIAHVSRLFESVYKYRYLYDVVAVETDHAVAAKCMDRLNWYLQTDDRLQEYFFHVVAQETDDAVANRCRDRLREWMLHERMLLDREPERRYWR
jgi:hypothetical protein